MKHGLIIKRWLQMPAIAAIIVAAILASPAPALATQGGVIVSSQNSCAVGPTNDNFLAPGKTAYVWLIFNSITVVRGYTYEITGTSSSFDSGILKIRFNLCRKNNTYDYWASFTTPTAPGGYTLTVFDQTGAKVSSDNFTVN
jgi:hypothetical protein